MFYKLVRARIRVYSCSILNGCPCPGYIIEVSSVLIFSMLASSSSWLSTSVVFSGFFVLPIISPQNRSPRWMCIDIDPCE